MVAGQTRNYRWSAGPALLMAELHRAGLSLRNPPIFSRVGIPGSGGPDWLRAHVRFEEDEAFGALQRDLSEAQWADLAARSQAFRAKHRSPGEECFL